MGLKSLQFTDIDKWKDLDGADKAEIAQTFDVDLFNLFKYQFIEKRIFDLRKEMESLDEKDVKAHQSRIAELRLLASRLRDFINENMEVEEKENLIQE